MSDSFSDSIKVGVVLATSSAILMCVGNLDRVDFLTKCMIYLVVALLNGLIIITDAVGIVNAVLSSIGWFAGSCIIASAFDDWGSLFLTIVLALILYGIRFSKNLYYRYIGRC